MNSKILCEHFLLSGIIALVKKFLLVNGREKGLCRACGRAGSSSGKGGFRLFAPKERLFPAERGAVAEGRAKGGPAL